MQTSNKQSLTPVLDAQAATQNTVTQNQADIAAALTQLLNAHGSTQTDVANLLALVQSENDATQQLIDGLTAVNGELDSNVTAINAHTTTKAEDTKDTINAYVKAQVDAAVATLQAQSGSVIKPIQRGLILDINSSNSFDVPISQVDMSKTMVIASAKTGNGSGGESYATIGVAAHLKNSTTLQIIIDWSYTRLKKAAIAWQVIEYV